MMSFPAGTTFTPYSVLRNVSDAPISVTPTLWWMAGAVSHSAQLASVSLQPHQTQSLDVMSLLTQAGLASATTTFNGSFSLVFDANIKPNKLLLASGSVDQTNTYVFEVVARGVARADRNHCSTGARATATTQWSLYGIPQMRPRISFSRYSSRFPMDRPATTYGPSTSKPGLRGGLTFRKSSRIRFPIPKGILFPQQFRRRHENRGKPGRKPNILIAVDSGT